MKNLSGSSGSKDGISIRCPSTAIHPFSLCSSKSLCYKTVPTVKTMKKFCFVFVGLTSYQFIIIFDIYIMVVITVSKFQQTDLMSCSLNLRFLYKRIDCLSSSGLRK